MCARVIKHNVTDTHELTTQSRSENVTIKLPSCAFPHLTPLPLPASFKQLSRILIYYSVAFIPKGSSPFYIFLSNRLFSFGFELYKNGSYCLCLLGHTFHCSVFRCVNSAFFFWGGGQRPGLFAGILLIQHTAAVHIHAYLLLYTSISLGFKMQMLNLYVHLSVCRKRVWEKIQSFLLSFGSSIYSSESAAGPLRGHTACPADTRRSCARGLRRREVPQDGAVQN